ncbi:MAG: DUF86 domain-containing protein [Bacteroidia bacterium]
MTEKDKKYLSDILIAIDFIERFLADTHSFEQYSGDQKTKSAVERQLAIIGEAVGNFMKLNPANTLENAKQIVNFRNRIVHAYDSVDDHIVWVIIQKHIPLLKSEVLKKVS